MFCTIFEKCQKRIKFYQVRRLDAVISLNIIRRQKRIRLYQIRRLDAIRSLNIIIRQNVCVVNLEVQTCSPSYSDLRISLVPLRYPVVKNLKVGIKHLSSNLKIPTLDIEIKRSRLMILHTKVQYGCIRSKIRIRSRR